MTRGSWRSCTRTKEHNDGLWVSLTVWSCGHSSQHSLGSTLAVTRNMPKLWYCNCSSLTLWLLVIQAVYRYQIDTCSEGGIFTLRDFYGRYTDPMAARTILFFVGMKNLLLLPEQWSWRYYKTNEQSLNDTHALWLCAQVSSLPAYHQNILIFRPVHWKKIKLL